MNPSNAGAHLNLGLLYDRHRNDLKQAIDHLQKARELGGAERYTAERLQAMIQGLQSRMETAILRKTPFAAEHKHTFSTCRGVMRFTEDGVEYRTTEPDHSFFEPWSNLRSLSVEGDEVSIRTRANKKYNFHLLGTGLGTKVKQLAAGHVSAQEARSGRGHAFTYQPVTRGCGAAPRRAQPAAIQQGVSGPGH